MTARLMSLGSRVCEPRLAYGMMLTYAEDLFDTPGRSNDRRAGSGHAATRDFETAVPRRGHPTAHAAGDQSGRKRRLGGDARRLASIRKGRDDRSARAAGVRATP